jgi:hypothetical protein
MSGWCSASDHSGRVRAKYEKYDPNTVAAVSPALRAASSTRRVVTTLAAWNRSSTDPSAIVRSSAPAANTSRSWPSRMEANSSSSTQLPAIPGTCRMVGEVDPSLAGGCDHAGVDETMTMDTGVVGRDAGPFGDR